MRREARGARPSSLPPSLPPAGVDSARRSGGGGGGRGARWAAGLGGRGGGGVVLGGGGRERPGRPRRRAKTPGPGTRAFLGHHQQGGPGNRGTGEPGDRGLESRRAEPWTSAVCSAALRPPRRAGLRGSCGGGGGCSPKASAPKSRRLPSPTGPVYFPGESTVLNGVDGSRPAPPTPGVLAETCLLNFKGMGPSTWSRALLSRAWESAPGRTIATRPATLALPRSPPARRPARRPSYSAVVGTIQLLRPRSPRLRFGRSVTLLSASHSRSRVPRRSVAAPPVHLFSFGTWERIGEEHC